MGVITGPTAPAGITTDLMTVLGGRDTRWFKGCLLKLNMMLIFLCLSNCGNGYDGSMMNGLQSLTNWRTYFNHPENNASLLGVFNAIQTIGAVVGLPLAPIVNDRLGRRWSIFIGNAIVLIATGIQAGAQNVGMFIGSRCLVGFGLSFACMGAPILITELAFPTHRAPVTSIFNTGWGFGSIIAAWTTYGTFRISNNWAWRLPSLLQGVTAGIQVIGIWFVPESPRWLIDHGRDEEARNILAKYHCNGNFDDPLLAFEFEEIKEAIRAEKENAQSSSMKELFTTKPNLRRLRVYLALAIAGQWSGSGIISYYLTVVLDSIGITSQDTQTLINGMNTLWSWIVGFSFALMIDKMGRRKMILISFIGMCFNFTSWTICSAIYTKSATEYDPACLAANGGSSANCVATNANQAAGHAILAFIFINALFYWIGIGPVGSTYALEILPYRLRTKGIFVYQMAVNAALVFNQYVNPIALSALGWRYYLVYCVFLAFEVVYFYVFLIETRGPNGPLPLEEISFLFEKGAYGFQKPPKVGIEDIEHAAHNDEKDVTEKDVTEIEQQERVTTLAG